MNKAIDMIEIEVEILAETPKAIRVSDGETTDWIPRSMISNMEMKRDKFAEITIPEWFAQERGFI